MGFIMFFHIFPVTHSIQKICLNHPHEFYSTVQFQDEKATGGPGPEDRPVTVEPELRHIEPLSDGAGTMYQ